MDRMNTLGKRIKSARENAGIMQAELATRIGVKSAGVISNWETDKSKPDADKIVALCNALDVSCSYLLDYFGSAEISSLESQLLNRFRGMSNDGQNLLLKIAFLDGIDIVKVNSFVEGLLSGNPDKKDISRGEKAV